MLSASTDKSNENASESTAREGDRKNGGGRAAGASALKRAPLGDRTNSQPAQVATSGAAKQNPSNGPDISSRSSVIATVPTITNTLADSIAETEIKASFGGRKSDSAPKMYAGTEGSNKVDSTWYYIPNSNGGGVDDESERLRAALREALEENRQLHEQIRILQKEGAALQSQLADLPVISMLYQTAKKDLEQQHCPRCAVDRDGRGKDS